MPRFVFVGYDANDPTRHILHACMDEAGIRTQDAVFLSWADERAIRRASANVIVALGDDAARACVPDWPDQNVMNERRGYWWDGTFGKTLTTVHHSLVQKAWVPWRFLLSYDLQRAKEESYYGSLRRPQRDVQVVISEEIADKCAQRLVGCKSLATDIEIDGDQKLLCVGFAESRNRAVVFPARYLTQIRRVLEAGTARKIGQNFMFDLHFLLTRCGIRVEGYADDTILAWHALYPELAGAAIKPDGKRRLKMTRKSLAFLASLFTTDMWWKAYDTDEDGMYLLNGRDCCITFDIMEQLRPQIDAMGVREVYEREVALVWPVVEMQARGLRVDERLRRERIAALTARLDTRTAELRDLALPIIRERIDRISKPHLFRETPVCKVCHNGKKKRLTCTACNGAGKLEAWDFNPGSDTQNKILLYEVLGLPPKMKDGKLCSDEESLKQLLAGVQA